MSLTATKALLQIRIRIAYTTVCYRIHVPVSRSVSEVPVGYLVELYVVASLSGTFSLNRRHDLKASGTRGWFEAYY